MWSVRIFVSIVHFIYKQVGFKMLISKDKIILNSCIVRLDQEFDICCISISKTCNANLTFTVLGCHLLHKTKVCSWSREGRSQHNIINILPSTTLMAFKSDTLVKCLPITQIYSRKNNPENKYGRAEKHCINLLGGQCTWMD